MVQAADYPYLVFTNTNGTNTVLSVSGLTFKVEDTSLQVTHSDGTTSFTLSDLKHMQFSVDGITLSALDHVLQADQPVEVFTLSGMRWGTYESLLDAVKALRKGTYVFKQGTNSQTIVVK